MTTEIQEAIQKPHYISSTQDLAMRIIAGGTKYASLLGGVYAVTQDEVNVGMAAASAGVYMFVDAVRLMFKDIETDNKMRTLETRVKG